MRLLHRHHLDGDTAELAGLTLLALALFLAASAGIAYVAGFDGVWRALEHPAPTWLAVSFAFVALSFGGYYFAYRGIGKVEGGPDELDTRSRLAAVTAGFGGFLAHGGSALDGFVMRAGGASEREARVRVALLAGLEHGILAFPCGAAAIALLASGRGKPPLDFTLPWAVVPPLGFAAAFWAAERYRERLRDADGWRGKLGVGLDATHLVLAMFRQPLRYGDALVGMLVFWLCDMYALWAAMHAFGFRMNGFAEIVAFGTAMIVTRRTGPLGGAGILMLALPPTLWVSGAPWAPAVLGTFFYRIFTLWLPMPFSFLVLPRLRRLGDEARRDRGERPGREGEPALR